MFVMSNERALNRAKITEEIERLQRLAADLGAIRDGHGPTAADLSNAPLLHDWARQIRPTACLVGFASDHPRFPGTGRPIVTSDLWVLTEHQGWARTLSRWYRLGSSGPAFK